MKHYYSVEEISTEIGISRQALTKRIKKLGLDTKTIGNKEKKLIIDSASEEIEKKKLTTDILSSVSSLQTIEILNETGSTLEQRLVIAKQKFDFVNQCIAECESAISSVGTIVDNANGSVSSNPAVKTMNELLKQHTALQKTINELEERLKLTSTSTQKAIDD